MNWYRVSFMAMKSDPHIYIRGVLFRNNIQANSPVDAIYRVVEQWAGVRGDVTQWVIDGDVEIPTLWEFMDGTLKYPFAFNLTIDEEDAELSKMVRELTPAEELQVRGVPTLFDAIGVG